MTPLPPDWCDFFAVLLSEKVELVVVGALAVAAHAEARHTEDLDVFIRPTAANGPAAKPPRSRRGRRR